MLFTTAKMPEANQVKEVLVKIDSNLFIEVIDSWVVTKEYFDLGFFL